MIGIINKKINNELDNHDTVSLRLRWLFLDRWSLMGSFRLREVVALGGMAVHLYVIYDFRLILNYPRLILNFFYFLVLHVIHKKFELGTKEIENQQFNLKSNLTCNIYLKIRATLYGIINSTIGRPRLSLTRGIWEPLIIGTYITVKAGQAYPQDSINELIIWKMNPLVIPVTSVKFKLASLHKIA